MVLLKNDGTLPWDAKKLHTVAVLGPTANSETALIGNYAGTPVAPVTLLAGLRAKLEPLGVKVLHETAVPLLEGYAKDEAFAKGTLFTSADLSTPGLRFEVFGNSSFEGKPLDDKPDQEVGRHWAFYIFAEDVPLRNACLRWSGVILAPEDGEYEFVLSADSAVKLELGGSVVVDSPTAPATKKVLHKLKLKKGTPCPVLLEYRQGKRDEGNVQLRWHLPARSDAYEAAMAAARQADHIVLTLGITPDLEGEEMPVKLAGFDGGDRTSLQLPAIQKRLLADVAALGKPVTVVLTTGSALILDTSKANALLCAWYYGQNGGTALAEILLGETNPSGRLPVTFYASDSDLPPFTDYSMDGRTYRYFKGKPLYAFGHGLSYTRFGYDGMQLSTPAASAGETVHVRVTVHNMGTKAGEEVVQLYASEKGTREGRALRQLIAFQRVALEPGERKQIEIPFSTNRLAHWDEKADGFVVEPTSYEIVAGPSSDVPAQTSVLSIKAKL
ncbi:MAG: glycoside hydrolase family 3 C-terminal domain-containing protein [Opitutaceae bacterium]